MKIVMTSKKVGYEATAEYDIENQTVTVKKNSILSVDIKYSATFKGANRIESLRNGIVENNILLEDITFNSLSTAANFVSGQSTNGLIKWKTENGKSVKESIQKKS